MFLGSAYSPYGINPVLLMALPVKQGACVTLPNGKAAADNEALITDSNADIVVETTVTDPITGEPAITHCRWIIMWSMSMSMSMRAW
ncbi:MAG: homoserine dehydrogenase [Candidatus Endobugula sp.]|jgi:homoserine dehydrogenase